MVIMLVNTLVLRVDGTNCASETVTALKKAGSQVTLSHINEILKNNVTLDDYHALVIPGGFSFGDHIAAGKIIANYLNIKLKKEILQFIDENKIILGICNGFQALLKSGLLDVEATLSYNNSGKFIDKWVNLRRYHKSPLTQGYQTLYVPINHGEGKFISSEVEIKKLEDEQRIIFKYENNPNGSYADIAGISNEQRNVFGLMPHPEKFINYYQHPYWTRLPKELLSEKGEGLLLFENLVKVCENL